MPIRGRKLGVLDRNHVGHRSIFAACLALLLALSVGATIVPRMSFEQIVGGSDTIVHGSVVKTWSAWGAEHRIIWTHYEIKVSESLKGTAGVRVVVSEPGGEVAGVAMQVAGVPQYSVGDEVVVFTTVTPIGLSRTSGWGQGKFQVVSGLSGAPPLVRSGVAGIRLVDDARKTTTVDSNATEIPSLNGLTLDKFKLRIREALRAQTSDGAR
jgi:hypothetical protein